MKLIFFRLESCTSLNDVLYYRILTIKRLDCNSRKWLTFLRISLVTRTVMVSFSIFVLSPSLIPVALRSFALLSTYHAVVPVNIPFHSISCHVPPTNRISLLSMRRLGLVWGFPSRSLLECDF